MAKGDIALIHIQCLNRSKDIWGPDAGEFRYGTMFVIISIIADVGATLR
jgi:hypothetical protein